VTPEFNLIKQHFTRPTPNTTLGVGDDAALISLSTGMELAISADMLVAGTHFFADCDAFQLGWKSLAVNVSDMAAMGANPKWATLAIALPEINNVWLAAFSKGLFACAEKFNIDLIGGDTTRGQLTICIQIMGEVPIGKAIKRGSAKIGDEIWVSGSLGNASMALAHIQSKLRLPDEVFTACANALHVPQPRVDLGLSLRDLASSAIDISDGLLADLGHILEQSHVGALLKLSNIPHIPFADLCDKSILRMVLAGGDDYELCFTAPASKHSEILKLSETLGAPISHIGQITSNTELVIHDLDGEILEFKETGFDHFN
jgi:thiamine-monophosphate kinase